MNRGSVILRSASEESMAMAGVAFQTLQMSLTVEPWKKGRTCTAQQAPCQILASWEESLPFASPFLQIVLLPRTLFSFTGDAKSGVNASTSIGPTAWGKAMAPHPSGGKGAALGRNAFADLNREQEKSSVCSAQHIGLLRSLLLRRLSSCIPRSLRKRDPGSFGI